MKKEGLSFAQKAIVREEEEHKLPHSVYRTIKKKLVNEPDVVLIKQKVLLD